MDKERLLELFEEDLRRDTCDLEEELQCRRDTIAAYLHRLVKTWEFGIWIPHVLIRYQLQMQKDAYINFLSCRRTFAWLSSFDTCGENYVGCVNDTQKRQWLGHRDSGIPTPKTELHL
ncbi:hypothetical protein Y032_0172g351 [Ancylostoma ceylanicum]|uniref:Uncharacterized protein n=1 Tax=Ancylostoma ceylanicum TaxID=53326 RepID=A0A016SV13_9BILA|nr:hypothetical protein Y032_0172g351 [Ancylostoma ceylanicum]